MKLSTISLAALSTVATADWVAPEFCHQLDCPSFTTRQVDAEVEVRTYDELLWASTDVQSDSVTDAGSIAFGRLFGYLSGANENSQTIDMTSPVLNKISPGSGPNCNNTFTVSFFVPYKYQTAEGPPKPTADDVYIQKIKISDVAVSVFGGFAEDSDVVSTASKLYSDIDDSKDIDADASVEDVNWFAAYDSPYTLRNRHNEDWINVVDL